jgi:hypothetical protein
LLVLVVLLAILPGDALAAQPIVVVTVDDFLPTRTLEVEVGTEVVFSDPRFLRVEMLPDEGAPGARPVAGGFAAVFQSPGTFRFLATLVGVERSGITPGHMIVRPRPGNSPVFDFSSARPGVTEAEFRLAQEECLREPRTAGSVRLYSMCMQVRGVQPAE